jgi:hypothetical protein
MLANSPSAICLFDAQVDRLQRCLYPAQIEVERMPPCSIEGAEKEAEKAASKGWVFKGRLDTPLGPVPTYERTIEANDALGVKVQVVQRRYLMCWEQDSLAVFTYRPANDLFALAPQLERAALTVRPSKVDHKSQFQKGV